MLVIIRRHQMEQAFLEMWELTALKQETESG